MKIAIGTNLFGQYHRQDLSKASLMRLKNKYSEIQLFDIQFKDEESTYIKSDGFNTLFTLGRSSKDVVPGTQKKMPFVNDIMCSISEQDSDYMVFLNSDILISDRLIKRILQDDLTAMPCSRMDIQDIKSIEEPIQAYRWEIGGFDVFVFKTEWFRKYKHLFEDFLMGRPWFDHHYAGLMKIFGNNDIIGNKNPPMCLHIFHGWAGCVPGAENDYNAKIFNNSKYTKFRYVWDDYFAQFLKLQRQPQFYFLNEAPNEAQVEKEWFDREIAKLKHDDETKHYFI